jgi:hypothetical protein
MGILTRRVLCLGQESAEWASFCGGRDMASDDKPKKDRAGETAGAKMKGSGERPFDMWLQKQLHAMYDEIASEPLPNDLLNLIEHDAEKKDKPPAPGSSRKK